MKIFYYFKYTHLTHINVFYSNRFISNFNDILIISLKLKCLNLKSLNQLNIKHFNDFPNLFSDWMRILEKNFRYWDSFLYKASNEAYVGHYNILVETQIKEILFIFQQIRFALTFPAWHSDNIFIFVYKTNCHNRLL